MTTRASTSNYYSFLVSRFSFLVDFFCLLLTSYCLLPTAYCLLSTGLLEASKDLFDMFISIPMPIRLTTREEPP